MPRGSIHVSRRDERYSLVVARRAWHARADQGRLVTRTTQRSRPVMDSQRKIGGQLLQATLRLVHGLVSLLIVAALSLTAFVAHLAERWQSVGKREDCVIYDDSSEEDNMPSLTRQNGRSRSSSTLTRTPNARQRHYLRRIRQRRTPSSHIICCPTEDEQDAKDRHCHVIFPQTLDKKGMIISNCDPTESSQENLCASDIQTSSRHKRHFPAGLTKTSSHAEERTEGIESDGMSHLEGLKSDATTQEACRLPPKKSKKMKAVHKYTHGSDAKGALHRKVADISLHHSKPDVSLNQGEINDSLWEVRLGISACQSDPTREAPSCQNSTRDGASVYYTDLENGAVGEGHEGGEGQNAKEGGQQQTQRENLEGGGEDKGQGYQCRTEAAGGLRSSGSGGDGGGDDDDDRGRKDEKRKMDEYLHLKKQRKKKKKKTKKAARAVKEGVTEMTSDGAGTLHVLSGLVSNTAARSSSTGHGWLVNHVSDGDAVHHSEVPPPPPPPPPPSAYGNDHNTLLPQSKVIPASSFNAGPKSTSQLVNDLETQPFGHDQSQPIVAEDIVTQPFNSDQPQPIAAEDIVTQPLNSDEWKTTVCCSQTSHENNLFKHPQQCEEDLQRERDLVSCCSQPISTQGELVQISLLEDALAAQTSIDQPAELKEVPGPHDICPVKFQLKRSQQCVEDLTLNAAAVAPPGHHGDGHIVHHDPGPQQEQNRRDVRSQITIRPNVVLVEKSRHDALREFLRDKLLENWYLRRRYRCQKCWTNNFTLVLCPCGHLLCRACGHTQTRCPVCNSMVESENFASFF